MSSRAARTKADSKSEDSKRTRFIRSHFGGLCFRTEFVSYELSARLTGMVVFV